ncbi:nuclear receptor-interacting protein 2 isoform X2 [Manis pentadactyla]|uniref:nuclear receptor-interacting protein 2 isoform X2 n=1 Tax=Manis pentadactyla TaxID=143292 RepID=UPI00255CE405|nr:nuclear receptor-interacting protein 2 isoform X2 [Manis pentadactyla]
MQAQTHTDPSPCPLRPGLSIGAAAERATCRPCQPSPSLSPEGFFQPKPPSLCCNLWKPVSDAFSRHFYLFIFLPPRPSWRESCSRDRAGGALQGLGGRGRRKAHSRALSPLLRPGQPAGAMSTRQESEREEGDPGRRGQKEAALRDRAHLSQRRRLRQATQFAHKDSADLLPLDSLKRLGTSKDLGTIKGLRKVRVQPNPFSWGLTEASHPLSQCRDQVLRVAVDTGTQHNQISAGCLSRLGIGKKGLKAPGGDPAPGPPTQVEQLELQLGQETVACSAQVVDDESPEFCLGLQTLLALKCCIDLEHGVLRLRAPFSELPFLPLCQEPGQ